MSQAPTISPVPDRPGPADEPGAPVLAVDLDGTLVRSDLLFESFWGAMSRDAVGALKQVIGGTGGRAGVKRRLAELVAFNPAEMPYNRDVLAYIERWRAEGGRVVLVTASDQILADQVAAHLGLFDAVHGSDGTHNLKGSAKAAFLTERYGPGGYVYVGDAEADLPVWAGAVHIVTVNAPARLRTRAAALGPQVEHLGSAEWPLKDWFKALRPHQWLKNILVFVPILASHAMSWNAILQSLGAFIAFCMVASSVYLVNDLLDLSADRAHPRKRHRSLAAGTVPIAQASYVAPALFLGGLIVSIFLGPLFVAAMAVYFAITLAYSLHLKRRTVIDIWVLAILYAMRIAAGVAATGIIPSVWLMAFSIFFFFSLAAVKRQAELVDAAERDEQSVRRRGYDRDDVLLIAMMAISSGYVSVLVMALYIRTEFVERLYSFPPALLGICLVLLYWISRIVMVTHRGYMHDDPLVFALKDNISRLCVMVCILFGIIASFAGGTGL